MTTKLEEVQRRIATTEIVKTAYVDLLRDGTVIVEGGPASAKNLRELANALDPREPVAWRVSYDHGASWSLRDHDPSTLLAGVMGVVIRPLVEA